ncbi:MAG TPA: hypothetical protein VJT73_12905 [Polyangiaceae bacterium]|nr:hypothetical protein [Polyangiaceae bacterium]
MPARSSERALCLSRLRGNLPQVRSADVRRAYCHTMNLVHEELHGSHAASLFHEAEAAKQQLDRANAATMTIASCAA